MYDGGCAQFRAYKFLLTVVPRVEHHDAIVTRGVSFFAATVENKEEGKQKQTKK